MLYTADNWNLRDRVGQTSARHSGLVRGGLRVLSLVWLFAVSGHALSGYTCPAGTNGGTNTCVDQWPIGTTAIQDFRNAWPTDAQWNPITGLNDPKDGFADTHIDFVGDTLNPDLVDRFGASVSGGQVVVKWDTQSEVGTLGFELQRLAADGETFEPVNQALISGAAAAGEGGSYALVDPGAFPDETYTYRLIEVERDGNRREVGQYTVTPQLQIGEERDIHAGDYTYTKRGASQAEAARVLGRKAEKSKSDRSRDKAETPQATSSHRAAIGVTETGLYYVSASELAAVLGWSESKLNNMIQGERLRLSNQGRDIAWLGKRRGEGLYFYGEASASTYDGTNQYVIEKGNGPTMQTLAVTPSAAWMDPSAAFPSTLTSEEDLFAATVVAHDPDEDYWHWLIFDANAICDDPTGNCRTHSIGIQAPDAAGSGAARLTIGMRGASSVPAYPDHLLAVSINGTPIGEGQWDGLTDHRLVLDFDQAIINDGANTVLIEARLGSGVPYDYSYLDDLTLTYQRRYHAEQDSLSATGGGNTVIVADGFSSRDIQLLDLTDPARPALVTGAKVQAAGDGYKIGFAPANADTPYLMAGPTALRSPASLRPMRSTGLTGRRTGAEYLVVAPEAFTDTAAPLIALRSGQGLSALFVALEAIYDDYGYGQKTPHAIRAFLADAASNWRQPPGYVVLGGKGTFDPKDYLGYDTDRVPVLMALTEAGLIAADQRFVDQDGDRIGDIPIGRLPAATAEELAVMVDKVVTYETARGPRPNRVILLADGPDTAGDYTAASEWVAGWPEQAGYTDEEVLRLYLAELSASAAHSSLMSALDEGSELLNYFGHSGVTAIDHGLLTATDVAAMNNKDRMPFVVGITCLMNRFEFPQFTSLGETLLLQPTGGAAVVWSSGGYSYTDQGLRMDDGLFKALFADGEPRLGDAVVGAISEYMQSGGTSTVPEIYNYLGDPASNWAR